MVGMKERLSLVLRMARSPRLRMDVKALRNAAEGYKSYAWELCKEAGLDDLLSKGASIEELIEERGVKDRPFLEHVLDFLAGSGVLEFSQGSYRLVREPGPFTGEKYRFLEEHYPNSVQWTNELRKRAKGALLSGKRGAESGFDYEGFLELWDGIMRESPWSFRELAIEKFSGSLKGGEEILDLGCGSGVSIEQMLLGITVPVKITGMDQSQASLDKARARLERLARGNRGTILEQNARAVELKRHDVLSGVPSEKSFDIVFMSLLLNHVPEKRRHAFFSQVREALRPGGKAVVYQIVHNSRFDRAAMWVMHAVPTHQDYPFREEYLGMLRDIFPGVRDYLGGVIVVAEK